MLLITLSTPVNGKPVKLSSSVRRRWPLYRSAIFFPFHTVARFTGHSTWLCLLWFEGSYYLRMRGLWGPCAFAKVAGKCWLPVCDFFFSFSSSNWRNKHKQSALDTMSTYIHESDLSGDETFVDIGDLILLIYPEKK